eukprot:SAG22_NODE_8883_length_624_cov_0.680000_1_plen_103_part_01
MAALLPVLLALTSAAGQAAPPTMQAVVADRCIAGFAVPSPALQLVSDRAVPVPGEGEVLVRVAASSVNPIDWKLLECGWGGRFPAVPGMDVAGTVAAVGPGCR